MIRVSSVRFLLTVSPQPMWMRVALAGASILGCATLWLNPADVDSALGSVLLLQMFAASTGFMAAASRGNFDPVLVTGRPRWRIALASIVAAALPGAAAWLAVVLFAVVLGQWAEALAAQRLVALFSVSCVSWAVGLTLPRAAAGGLWSLLLVALALWRGSASLIPIVHSAPVTLAQAVHASAAVAVCPFLLLGSLPGAIAPRVLLLDGCITVFVAAAGVRLICSHDYALMEPA